MISENVYNLTHSSATVTAALAASPNASPGALGKNLYKETQAPPHAHGGVFGTVRGILKVGSKGTGPESTQVDTDEEPSGKDLDRAAECGQFGTRPSDLFLKIYHDVLCTLDHDPWCGVVSPPLLGSRGVIPISIISAIPDIIQHHYECIIRAESEVFLATNFWQASKSATKICDAFLELSRRAVRRNKKVVVKVMYDRANLRMLTESHLIVSEEEWISDEVKMPKRSQMPGLEFELLNFHQPILGTFHSKFMVVDRKVALLCSNNIQDRANVEMMVQLEGPIVDSIYDTAIISWYRSFSPPLVCLDTPYQSPADGYKFGMDNMYITTSDLDGRKGKEIFDSLNQQTSGTTASTTSSANLPFISGIHQSITDHLNAGDQPDTMASKEFDPSTDEDFTPHILHAPHPECPIAIVNRRPYGKPVNDDLNNPQNIAWLAGLKYAKSKVFIQTPTFSAKPIVDGVLDAVRRGIECILFVDVGFNDGGEALPLQGGTNEEVAKQMFAVLKDDEKDRLRFHWYTAKDQDKPINAHMQQRNCHVKLMIIDDMVGIQGNGNQDVQSWFHSQEVNVMVDSPVICREWLDAIHRNQNTHLHRLGSDGIYRDQEGNPLSDSTGIKSGPLGIVKGIQGSIARVRGKGGF